MLLCVHIGVNCMHSFLHDERFCLMGSVSGRETNRYRKSTDRLIAWLLSRSVVWVRLKLRRRLRQFLMLIETQHFYPRLLPGNRQKQRCEQRRTPWYSCPEHTVCLNHQSVLYSVKMFGSFWWHVYVFSSTVIWSVLPMPDALHRSSHSDLDLHNTAEWWCPHCPAVLVSLFFGEIWT